MTKTEYTAAITASQTTISAIRTDLRKLHTIEKLSQSFPGLELVDTSILETAITERKAADYEMVPQVGRYSNPAVKHIVQILMERDDISEQEAQRMVDDCRQQLLSEAVPPRRLRSGRGNLG